MTNPQPSQPIDQTPPQIPPNQPDESVIPESPKSSRKGGRWLLLVFVLVLGLLSIPLCVFVAGGTLISLNPAENFQNARNTERQAELNQLSNALYQFNLRDSIGIAGITNYLGKTIPNCPEQGKINVDINEESGRLNFDFSFLIPSYLAELPEDPLDETPGGDTGYTICLDGEAIQLSAPLAEGEESITVTR